LMKKLGMLSFILWMLFTTVFAQNTADTVLKNKKGNIILPVKGDFAAGLSANQVFNYLGNMFSGSGTNYLSVNLLHGNTFFFKYFVNDKAAIRLRLSTNIYSKNYENEVPSDFFGPTEVTDQLKMKSNNMNFSVGIEKRKSLNRFQISYGAEALFSFNNNSNQYTYGNPLTNSNPTATTTVDFVNGVAYQVSSRITELSQSNGTGLGIRPFLAVEYFIIPKVSIGTELGLNALFTFNATRKRTIESWNAGVLQTETFESVDHSYAINQDDFGGQIILLFHF